MRKKCLIILLLVLSILAIAFVQSASATTDPADREVEIQTGATEGLLPIPEYSEDWKTRSTST